MATPAPETDLVITKCQDGSSCSETSALVKVDSKERTVRVLSAKGKGVTIRLDRLRFVNKDGTRKEFEVVGSATGSPEDRKSKLVLEKVEYFESEGGFRISGYVKDSNGDPLTSFDDFLSPTPSKLEIEVFHDANFERLALRIKFQHMQMPSETQKVELDMEIMKAEREQLDRKVKVDWFLENSILVEEFFRIDRRLKSAGDNAEVTLSLGDGDRKLLFSYDVSSQIQGGMTSGDQVEMKDFLESGGDDVTICVAETCLAKTEVEEVVAKDNKNDCLLGTLAVVGVFVLGLAVLVGLTRMAVEQKRERNDNRLIEMFKGGFMWVFYLLVGIIFVWYAVDPLDSGRSDTILHLNIAVTAMAGLMFLFGFWNLFTSKK